MPSSLLLASLLLASLPPHHRLGTACARLLVLSMRKGIIEIPLDEVQPPDEDRPVHFRIDATPALSLSLREEATVFAKAVCSSLVEAGAGDYISFNRAAFDSKANKLVVRGSALPAAFQHFDSFFPPSQRASLQAGDGVSWSVSIVWMRRPLPHHLLLANVPQCSPNMVQARLQKAGFDVQSVSYAPTAYATFGGSRNFSAFLVVVIARLDQLPSSLRFKNGTRSFDVRVDRYLGGRVVVDAVDELSPSWASVVASPSGTSPAASPSPQPGVGAVPLGSAGPPAGHPSSRAASSADAPSPHLPESTAPEIVPPCASPPSLEAVASPPAVSGPSVSDPASPPAVSPPSGDAPPSAASALVDVPSVPDHSSDGALREPVLPSPEVPSSPLVAGGPHLVEPGPSHLALAVVVPTSQALVPMRRASLRARPRSRSPSRAVPPRPARGKRAKGAVDGAAPTLMLEG